MPATLNRSLLALPPVPDTAGDRAAISQLIAAEARKIVVLDDDPTGTQTVHEVDVLTEWSVEALTDAFANPESCLFILTNTRAMHEAEAVNVVRQIVRNVRAASAGTGRGFSLISRGDSTLRGHFPAEIDAITQELDGVVDGICVVPAFFEAGRHTIDGTHYLHVGADLVPVAETEFARDVTFGYRNSHLPAWIEEKSGGRIAASDVEIVSLDLLRRGGASEVARRLKMLPRGTTIVVDGENPADMEIFVHAVLLAERGGRRYVFRTAAGFVRVRAGLASRAPLGAAEIVWAEARAGVIVVGSYVAQSTLQLQRAQALAGVCSIEVPVAAVLDPQTSAAALTAAAEKVAEALASGRHALIFTSRGLASSAGRAGEIGVAQRVSEMLVDLVRRIEVRPRFFIAKGGITSSDLAVKALGVRRARVLGQAAAGIPVWRLGRESRFPGMAYVVFPGNVGGPDSLAALIAAFSVVPAPGQPRAT